MSANDTSAVFTCTYCDTESRLSPELMEAPTARKFSTLANRSYGRGEYGKALQFVEEGLRLEPDNTALLELEEQARGMLQNLAQKQGEISSKVLEAEQYYLQSQWILNKLQANNQVYGNNSSLSGATPADVDLGLKYVDRALEHFPDNASYLNLKGLLTAEGKGDTASAILLLEKAHALAPKDITIESNLQNLKSNGCFVATAALGSADHPTVKSLRIWRDDYLLAKGWGRVFVDRYYKVSPALSKSIERRPLAKKIIRCVLSIFVIFIRR